MVMRSVGSSTLQAGQRPRILGVGDGVPDGHVRQPGHGHDLARAGLRDLLALDARAVVSEVTVPVRVTVRPGSTEPSGAGLLAQHA